MFLLPLCPLPLLLLGFHVLLICYPLPINGHDSNAANASLRICMEKDSDYLSMRDKYKIVLSRSFTESLSDCKKNADDRCTRDVNAKLKTVIDLNDESKHSKLWIHPDSRIKLHKDPHVPAVTTAAKSTTTTTTTTTNETAINLPDQPPKPNNPQVNTTKPDKCVSYVNNENVEQSPPSKVTFFPEAEMRSQPIEIEVNQIKEACLYLNCTEPRLMFLAKTENKARSVYVIRSVLTCTKEYLAVMHMFMVYDEMMRRLGIQIFTSLPLNERGNNEMTNQLWKTESRDFVIGE